MWLQQAWVQHAVWRAEGRMVQVCGIGWWTPRVEGVAGSADLGEVTFPSDINEGVRNQRRPGFSRVLE